MAKRWQERANERRDAHKKAGDLDIGEGSDIPSFMPVDSGRGQVWRGEGDPRNDPLFRGGDGMGGARSRPAQSEAEPPEQEKVKKEDVERIVEAIEMLPTLIAEALGVS